MAPALESGPASFRMDCDNGGLLGTIGHDHDHFLFLGDGDVIELFGVFGAGALSVEDGAAGGPRRPGGVHDQVRAALVGNGDDQLVHER